MAAARNCLGAARPQHPAITQPLLHSGSTTGPWGRTRLQTLFSALGLTTILSQMVTHAPVTREAIFVPIAASHAPATPSS